MALCASCGLSFFFPKIMKIIDRSRLQSLMQREQKKFIDERPKSKALFERARKSLLAGVPMNWMVKWAGAFPPFVREAQGAHFFDVDGHRYTDFCLGDTGAMTGHSPFATVKAAEEQMRRGITLMLPGEDAIFVAEELQKRFNLPYWQFALTATDANRFSIRLCRQITGRPKILVYNWCYHGTVDETFINLAADGTAGPRPGNIGPPVNPAVTTKVVEFNDIPALEQALAAGDVACVLAEPAMTNVGIVHPQPGYHKALRELTRKYETLLIIDETHTICAGPGGYTRAENLEPDVIVFGKAIGAGIPGAAYGFSQELADRIVARQELENCDVGGIGGTLAGNALSLAAMRATLTQGPDQRSFRPHDSDGGALDCGRRQSHCRRRSAVACDPSRLPRRIHVRSRAEDRNPGPRRHGLRTGAVHASLRHESRHSAHALPQHGFDVPADRSRRRGQTHKSLP